MVETLGAVGTLEQIEVLERLDFDVPCDAPSCETAAVWTGTYSCCGYIDVLCNRHRRITAEALATFHRLGIRAIHGLGARPCFMETLSVMWKPLRGES